MAEKAAAVKGHNEQSEREMWEEQQFLNAFRQIKEHKSDIAGTTGEMSGIYDRLKKIGFTKADVKWAEELDEKDAGEIIATMQRRLRIARMFGHGVARQIEMFDADRVPIDERAYEEGLAAGKRRKGQGSNPYDPTSSAGQAWLRGEADGNAFANRDLSHVMDEQDSNSGDELIKAGGEDPFADAQPEAAE